MKKLFAIAFTCVYLTLAVGVASTTHYCMGRVKSTTLFSFETDRCCCALFASEPCHHCCDDKTSFVSIEDDHSASWVIKLTPDFYELGSVLYALKGASDIQPPSTLNVDVSDTGPPLTVPLFRRHCALVFYDHESIV